MTIDERKQKIRKLFKNYKRMNHRIVKALREMGLILTESGGHHWRLENISNGRITFIPQTPGDWRSGRNTIRYVCQIL